MTQRFIKYLGLMLPILFAAQPTSGQPEVFDWSRLPDIPDPEGFAGMYSGISGGALIAAGGANFFRTDIGEPGGKRWTDAIFVLTRPDGTWHKAEAKLPKPIGYGVSVTHNDSMICVGGNNAEGLYSDVFSLTWDGNNIQIARLPDLPQPNAYAAGAIVGDILYVAGGVPEPGAAEPRRSFYALDLSVPEGKRSWQSLDPWPGPGRQLAVAAVQDGQFFLISGISMQADERGEPTLRVPYLMDSYAYQPGTSQQPGQWRRLADLSHAVAAAPSPACPLGTTQIAVFGGVDGTLNNTPPDRYPPLPRKISVYDNQADQWTTVGQMPDGAGRVTAPACFWDGRYVIISGERKPRYRSPNVFVAEPTPAGLRK